MPEFSTNWMRELGAWRRHLKPFVGRAARALEIGSFEGRSAIWLLENVLTHPASTITCVDPFQSDRASYRRFLANTQPLRQPASTKCLHIRKTSREFFCSYFDEAWSIVYVDGSHVAFDVLLDLLQSWERLKPGGILIVDDLVWDGYNGTGRHADGPRRAWGAFLSVLAPDSFTILHERAVGFVRKKQATVVGI